MRSFSRVTRVNDWPKGRRFVPGGVVPATTYVESHYDLNHALPPTHVATFMVVGGLLLGEDRVRVGQAGVSERMEGFGIRGPARGRHDHLARPSASSHPARHLGRHQRRGYGMRLEL